MEEEKLLQTLYLDQDEEINNAINKVKNCEADQVALVLPEKSKGFNQETNLKLLKYFSDQEKKSLILVCSDSSIRALAHKLGIVTVAALSELAATSEEKSELALLLRQPKESKLPIYLVGNRKLLTFLGGLLLLGFILGVVYVNLPWTTIEIIPATKNFEEDLSLTISPDFQEIDLAKKTLPAREKTENFVLTNDFPATGIKLIGKTKARGSVVFINENRENVFLPAGTVLSSLGGVEFVTIQDVSIPKRKVEMFMGVPVGLAAGRAQVAIEAKEPGTKGNVGSGEITQGADKSGVKLRVVNAEPTSGGEDQEIKVVTKEDLLQGEKGMAERAKQLAITKLSQGIGPEDLLLNNSINIKKIKIGYNKKINDQGDRFTAEAQVESSIFVVPKNSLEKLGSYWLKIAAGNQYKLRNSEARVVSWQGMLMAPRRYKLNIHIAGEARAELNSGALKEELKGKTTTEAETALTKMAQVGHFKIDGKKQDRIPANSFFIKIVIKNPVNE